ncbi:MFS transporter [Mesorhizobium retamae]|uniref:MFS transporter n=1 Tax=Mesorhizobium retamae TaxID=2912854 RepID=A0ABS9QH47_9HYPH|nr:MFS transporter [Mesorhizobium sp. IRAMC:0171]MCG7506784.1 MFS transporter [Mesorhizobium sp. IRAMC:0171]
MSDENRPAAASAANPPDPRRWQALGLLCATYFMVCLDGQIVILALPSIERQLGFTVAGVQWVMSAYMLTVGGLLLLGGRMADLLGRRRMFVTGTALFLISSLLCGFAGAPEFLVAMRIVQGIAAAIMTPTALSILMTTFEEGRERNKALGFWSAMGAGGATAALVVGGPLNDWLGWPWVFFINVPVCLALLAFSPYLLKESRDTSHSRGFDVAGAVTVTAGLMAFVYAMVEVPQLGWTHANTLVAFGASALLLLLFLVIEMRSASPLVPLRIFRSVRLVCGNLVVLLAGMIVFGMILVLSLYMQKVLGYSALQVGVSTMIYAAASIVMSYASGPIASRLGARTLAVIAMAMMAAGCLLLARAGGNYWIDILPGLIIFGPGIGAAVVSGSIAALSDVAESDSGLASGINSAAFQLGGALGVAVMATVSLSWSGGLETLAALTTGYQAGFLACAALAGIGLLVALFLPGRTLAGAASVVHHG